MKFGNWLNSLSGLDHLIILFCLGLADILSHYLLKAVRQLYYQLQKDNIYAPDFRITPILFFIFALPLTVAIYLLLGIALSNWLAPLAN